MARRYYLSDSPSNLGVGVDFTTLLLPNIVGTTSTASVSLAANATRISTAFTPAFHPGVGGAVSTIIVVINITSGQSQCALNLVANRVNVGGSVVIASSVPTAEQITNAGIQTHTFTNLNLGTWGEGDRLRLDYRFRNTATKGGTRTVIVLLNSTTLTVEAPGWRGRKVRAT